MLSLLVNTQSPTQDGLLLDFLSQGTAIDPDLVKGDVMLAVSHQPVMPSTLGTGRPWDADFATGDTFQIAIGNKDTPPTSGTFVMGVQRSGTKTVTSTSAANPSVIVATAHGMSTGDVALFLTSTASTPDLNGTYQRVTVVDANTFTVPVNVTGAGTGGTFQSYSTSGLATLAYNVSAATLQTALNTVLTAQSLTNVTVALINASTGTYSIQGNTNGAIPLLYANGGNLLPLSSAVVNQVFAGGASQQALQVLQLEQLPVAYCTPSTLFPAAAVTASIAQAGSSSPNANKIYSVGFTSGTYAGTYNITITNLSSVSATVTASTQMSLTDLQTLVNGAPNITVGDIAVLGSVAGGYSFTFQGTQAASNVPTLAVANIDLLAPQGVTGQMNLNNYNLFVAFEQVTSDTLTFTLSIRRTRLTGEQSEYFIVPVVLKRNLINPSTMVPLALATYYTSAQVDALFAAALVAEQWMLRSGPFTASVGTKYQIDTSGGAVTMTLPNGMSTGDWIEVQDAGLSWGTNALTIALASTGRGTKINGVASAFVDSVVGDKLTIAGVSSGFGVRIS